MRSAGFLSIGVAGLLALPVAAAVAAEAAGRHYAAQSKMDYSAALALPQTTSPTQRPRTGNLTYSVPKVAFGLTDSLPAVLSNGERYSARILVWVTPGVDDAQATLFDGDQFCQNRAAPGGQVEALTCTVTSGARSSATLRVEVRTSSGVLMRAMTYRHTFAGS